LLFLWKQRMFFFYKQTFSFCSLYAATSTSRSGWAQRRACLCCWFTDPNDIGWIQRGPGTNLSWEELELLVKGITGESFVPESLILPQGIPALCDDPGLRTAILATLPTLDESGVAVR
jgi:hypothetical protein